MKTKRSTAGTAAKLIQMQALAPAIAARRLSQLQGLTPMQAALEWNRWALEKAFAFSSAGMTLMLGTAAGRPGTAARALAPLHARVTRNAKRRRG